MIQAEEQLSLYLDDFYNRDYDTNDWTFSKAQTRQLTHCFHDYPARMIPQVASKLLKMFGGKSKVLFDPYCGTGTSLVEGVVYGMQTIGTDLNPLARLIAKAKTSSFKTEFLLEEIQQFHNWTYEYQEKTEKPELPDVKNMEFWFKPNVSRKLKHIKDFINLIEDTKNRLFFQVAFSETVRESSNTRNSEFKLYRYNSETLTKFDPNVFSIMTSKLYRNIEGAREFSAKLQKYRNKHSANIYGFNTCVGIPEDIGANKNVDIVVTSPPYGDSSTTVAYGQYSRLSAAWLELEEPTRVDKKLMGGSKEQKIRTFPSKQLNKAIIQISNIDEKRALSVSSFYNDLQNSIENICKIIKISGYACYVVGNRKVKGVTLPTDNAVRSFFENMGFEHINTFTRNIPNKRMPLKNSPTNIKGIMDNTMTKEFVIVMQKNENSHYRKRNNRDFSSN